MNIEGEMDMLREQNKKLIEALKFYADESHYQKECIDSRIGAVEEVIIDNGRIARNTLTEYPTWQEAVNSKEFNK